MSLQAILSEGRRKGVGDRVFASTLNGGSAYGYPGAWAQDRVEMVMHFRHWVYRAVGAICDEVAGLEPNVAWVTHKDAYYKGKKSALRQRRRVKSLSAIGEHEEVEHVEPTHPLYRLLSAPNEWDTPGALWYELVMFLKLTGNAYLWVVPNGMGKPCELWVVPSQWCWPRIGPSKQIDRYEVRPFTGGLGQFNIPADEIIWIRYKSPVNKLDGWSPQFAGSEWIDCDDSVWKSRFATFKNGCFPFGAIELDSEFEDPDSFQLDRIYAKFFARSQGELNSGRPLIMPPGAKFNPLQISPAEMLYMESASQCRDNVLALFGCPKEVIGIQDAGSEIAMYGPMAQFSRYTICPLLRMLSQELTLHLAKRWDNNLKIWWDDPTPDNPEQVNRDIETDLKAYAVVPNEVRTLRGREPYAHGGDDPMALGPMGVTPIPLHTGEDLSFLADIMPGADQYGVGPATGRRHEKPIAAGQEQEDQPEVEQTAQTADLLATVGGINGAIDILAKISDGTISVETGVQLFVLFFGISDEDARQIIGNPPTGTKPTGGDKPAIEVPAKRLLMPKGPQFSPKCGGEGSGVPGPCPEGGADDKPSVPPHSVNQPNQKLPSESRVAYEGLSPKDIEAIKEYSWHAFDDVNAVLRGDKPATDELTGYIEKIDGLFDKTPEFSEPVSVYRGVRASKLGGKDYIRGLEDLAKNGGTMESKGFLSTSTNPRVAIETAVESTHPVVFDIEAVKGLDMKPYSNLPKEDEMLLPRDTSLQIVSVEKKEDKSTGETYHLVKAKQVIKAADKTLCLNGNGHLNGKH